VTALDSLSACLFQTGQSRIAFRDATQAAKLLAALRQPECIPPSSLVQLSKAKFRQGLALMQLGRVEDAIRSYRSCAKDLCTKDPALLNEMLKAAERCTTQWTAQVLYTIFTRSKIFSLSYSVA
jgi:hypothetical protein